MRPARARWTVGIVTALVALWVVLALMGRGIVPGSAKTTDALFAVALGLTYLGVWSLLVVVARSPRTMLYRGIATTFTLLAVLVVLELPAALRWVHWTVILRRLAGERADYGTAYVYDAELSFRRIPNLSWSTRPLSDVESGYGLPRTAERRITFTYDRWGYRNTHEMEHADVVLLGDSYVEGWYVSDGETVAARLAERLGRPVADLGVAGYGTLQELRVLKGDAVARAPRVVVWFFFEGNDLYDDQHFENYLLAEPPSPAETVPHPDGLAAGHGWKQRSFVLEAWRSVRRWAHPLVPNRAPYWAMLRGRSGTAGRVYFADYAQVPWTDYEVERWATARSAIEEGAAFAASRGIELVLAYVPIKYRVYEDVIEVPPESPIRRWQTWSELPELFGQLCEAISRPCLDLTDPFVAAARRGLLPYARTDTHWSAEGHALAAARVAALLADEGLLAAPDPASESNPRATSPAPTR